MTLITGRIPKKHITKAVDLLEYAPTGMDELAEWLQLLPVHQAISVGMLAIADLVTRPFSISHLQAALFALEAKWAEAGPLLKARDPYPTDRPSDPAAPTQEAEAPPDYRSEVPA